MATKKQQHPSRPSASISAADRAMRQRLEALALGKQMETIARIHSRSVTHLNVVRDIGAPGGSNEGAIYLDAEELPPPVTRDAIATWIGVTMHEVGHTRWSPSMRQFPSHLQRVYNLAEDARQERLVLEAYPGAVTALTRAVADLIIAQPGMTSAGLWPLLAGRLYLPDELRRAVFDGAVLEMGAEWADEVRDLIADYCDLVDPGFVQNNEACSILVRLRGLLDELPEMPQSGCNAEGKAQPEADAPGRQVDPIPRVRAIADEGEDGDGEDGDGEDGDGNGGDKSDADADADSDGGAGESPDDGDGDGEDGGGGSSESESDGDGDGDGDADGDGKSDSEASSDSSGKGTSAGGPKKTPESNKQRKEVEKEAKAVSEDAGVKLGKLAEAVLDRVRADAFGAKDVTRGSSQYAVASESRQAAARLMSSLKPLIDAAEAGLEKLTASGRVKPHRIERGYRPDHVFDKWQMDLDDAVSAEIVVSVDTSGSMSNWDNQLSQAIWVIRQVAARTAANVTVISWDNTAEVVTSPLRNDTTWSVYRGGGTQALPMLKLATAIFERSQMDKKWMLVMTDGHVQDAENQIASLVARLTAMHVAITPLGFGPSSKPEVFGDNARKIESLLELPKVIGALLYDLYRSNVVR